MKGFSVALTLIAALALVIGITSNVAAEPYDFRWVGLDDWSTAYQDGQISPVTVAIDIKPGSYPNSVNPRSKGVIPVAVLTTVAADGTVFDATQVDPATVAFGPNGAPEVHNRGHIEDVDNDGDLDMVLHFATRLSGIACGDTEAVLTGMTYAGVNFEGKDSIKTAGCK